MAISEQMIHAAERGTFAKKPSAAERPGEERRERPERRWKDSIGLVAFDETSCTGGSPSLGTQREVERATAERQSPADEMSFERGRR
jgi:hypothetical protein